MMWGLAVLVLIAHLGIAAYEVPRMLRKGQRGELIAFSVILGMALVLSLLLSLGIKVPSPTEPIEALFGPLGKALIGGGGK